MAKTTFIDDDPSNAIVGTTVLAAFLNSIYQAGGGHVHDGGTDDGHAPLINLATNTTGELPELRRYAHFYKS
jgi:hypothetical protein